MAFDSLVRVRMPDGSVIDVGQSYAAALGLEVVASTTPLTSVPDPTYAGPAGTKGELVVGGANGLLGRLTPGGANRVLVADPTQPLGVKWAIAADQFADLGTSDGQMTAVAANPESAFAQQQSSSIDVRSAQLDATGKTTAQINAWLAGPSPFGTSQKLKRLMGNHVSTVPLRVPSHTVFDCDQARITLAPNSNCNMLTNANILNSRSVYDASITGGTTTLTSATAAFVPSDVGAEIVVWDAGWHHAPFFTTIASRTNATTVVLTAAPPLTVTEMAISIGPRDKNVTVRGGVWDSNGNQGPAGLNPDLHVLRLHRVDGLRIEHPRVTGLTAGYGISPGDVTDYTLDGCDVDTLKGIIQVSGPAYNGLINDTHGQQFDDFIAFTCSDYPGNMECFGPIRMASVTNTYCKSNDIPAFGTAAVKLLAGNKYWMSDITVDGIYGTSRGAAFKIGDDPSQATTTDSKMRGIVGRNIFCQVLGDGVNPVPPMVEISVGTNSQIEDIEIDGVHWNSGSGVSAGVRSAVVAIFNAAAVGPTAGLVTLRNIHIKAGDYLDAVLVQRVTVNRLVVEGVDVPVAGTNCNLLRINDTTSHVVSASFRGVRATLAGASTGISNAGQIDRCVIEDSEVVGGAALFQSIAQGLPRTALKMANVYSEAGSVISAASPFDLDAAQGVTHAGTQAIIDTPYVGAEGSSIYGHIRNPLGRTKLSNAGGAAVSWVEPVTQAAYSSAIGDILAMSPALWVRSEGLSTLANNTAVATWPDSSGNARHLAQSTAGQRPLYKTAQINGLAAVVFDGADDWLSRAAFPLPGPAVTVFAVARLDAAGSYGDLLSYNATELEVRHNAATRKPEIATSGVGGGSVVSATALTLGTAHLWTASLDNAAPSFDLRIDQASVASAALAFVHGASAVLGVGARSSGSQLFGGAIGELLIIPRAVTTAERTAVESYLKAKWATP